MDHEEKPKHERILERMNAMVRSAVSKFSINGEGGMVVMKNVDEWLISKPSSGLIKHDGEDVPWVKPTFTSVLDQTPNGIRVLMGSMSGMVATLDGNAIYGSAFSAPKITNPDCDVYLKLTLLPSSFYYAAQFKYLVSNLTLSSAIIETVGIGVVPTTTNGEVSNSTGVITTGTYYFWIGRIVGGLVDHDYNFLSGTYPDGDDFGAYAFTEGSFPSYVFSTQTWPEITYTV